MLTSVVTTSESCWRQPQRLIRTPRAPLSSGTVSDGQPQAGCGPARRARRGRRRGAALRRGFRRPRRPAEAGARGRRAPRLRAAAAAVRLGDARAAVAAPGPPGARAEVRPGRQGRRHAPPQLQGRSALGRGRGGARRRARRDVGVQPVLRGEGGGW